MRNKETYENTLTGKLETLPIPDMEDAIWSRIEAQLDIDLPTDDGGGNTPAPGSPFGFCWLGGAGLFCVTAILISLFAITQSKDREGSSTTTFQDPPSEKIDSSSNERPPPGSPRRNAPNSSSPNNTINNSTDSGSRIDTSTNVSIFVPPLAKDSAQLQPGTSVAFTPPKDTITRPPKRQRGVRGISDSDYKIVPKKDST